jgi:hypothetical protein
MFGMVLLGDTGVKAEVGDVAGDPDGPAVFRTAQHLSLTSIWLSMLFDHLLVSGLTAPHVIEFLQLSPLFAEDRIPLITKGVEAHIGGDYVRLIF